MSEPAPEPWWSGYFDEQFVNLYQPLLPPEETLAEVEGVIDALGLPPGARVLDVACGWGRHALELAAAGYRVTGLDRSAVLLDLARRHAGERSVQDLTLVQGDMRDLPFRESFDAVVSLFSSLGYFHSDEDDVRVLESVRRALKPDGQFVLEIMHRDQVVRDFVERDWWEGADGAHVWVEREFDAVAGVSREWLRWTRGEQQGEKFHTIRVRSATEWGELLARAGLEPVEWFGDWELRPFAHTSERLIVVARP